jgi:hypothetical protein
VYLALIVGPASKPSKGLALGARTLHSFASLDYRWLYAAHVPQHVVHSEIAATFQRVLNAVAATGIFYERSCAHCLVLVFVSVVWFLDVRAMKGRRGGEVDMTGTKGRHVNVQVDIEDTELKRAFRWFRCGPRVAGAEPLSI